MKDWVVSELREGRLLNEYLRREKAQMDALLRQTARTAHTLAANPKSDFKFLGAIPARLYHRWRNQDKDFWRDDANLRSLRRDNPDLAACIKI